MLKNYFKIAWRNILRNRGLSMINVGGLAIGLAGTLAIALFVWDEYSYDRFHPGFENIYRLVEEQTQGGNRYDVAVTPGPLAPALESDFSEVLQTCRISRTWQAAILKVENQRIETPQVLIVDNSFFSLFDFKILKGNSELALQNPDEVVISESLAEKLFGGNWETEQIIGNEIEYNSEKLLKVAGVIENAPVNSHIQYDLLLSYKIEETNSNNYNWNSNNAHTYLSLNSLSYPGDFNTKIENYLSNFSSDSTTTLALQPLSEIYLYSDFDFQTDWAKTGNITVVRVFVSVGIVVLLIAIFNFINLSTAGAVKRSKEVGVRKVIGARQNQLVAQFLSEAFMIAVLAMVFALTILQIFLPLLNSLAGKSLYIPFSSISFLLFILMGTIAISLLAGVYPAFFLSRFKPDKVLKGGFSIRSGQFRQTLIVVQFTFSVVLIISTFTIYNQLDFLRKKELGFDKEHLIQIYLGKGFQANSELIKGEMLNYTGILDATLTTGNLVNLSNSTGNVTWEGNLSEDKILLSHMSVDSDFIPATGIELITGRNFDSKIARDSLSFLLNETGARQMGWTPTEAIGKSVTFWDNKGFVIGVVKDFHFRPMTATIEPILFRSWTWEAKPNLLVRLNGDQVTESLSIIESIYKKYSSDNEFRYQFIDQALDNQYRSQKNTGLIVLVFCVLAITVSCLGLIGLAAHTAEKRTKEIGVRKVLGASIGSIVQLLSGDFTKPVILAILIASPIAFWISNQWLESFAYKIELEWWTFALAGFSALGIALLTVSGHSLRAALMNPVNSLKSE
jgi:putative ABC transport system permease protein